MSLTLIVGDCDAYYSMPMASGNHFSAKYVVKIELEDEKDTDLIFWKESIIQNRKYKIHGGSTVFSEDRPYLQPDVLKWLRNNIDAKNYHFLDVHHTDRFESSSPFLYMDFPIQFKKYKDARAFIKKFLPKGQKLTTFRKK